jgi:hypothetical protein
LAGFLAGVGLPGLATFTGFAALAVLATFTGFAALAVLATFTGFAALALLAARPVLVGFGVLAALCVVDCFVGAFFGDDFFASSAETLAFALPAALAAPVADLEVALR